MQTKCCKSSHIDDEIKKLLFANPSIGMKATKGIIAALKYSSNDSKKELRRWLSENLAIFKKKSKEYDTPPLHSKLFDQVNKHVEQWEEEFGKVSLSDIQLLTERTDIRLVDIGWMHEKITPSSIAMLLDEYMVGQEEYKQALGLTIYTHMLRVLRPSLNLPKLNLLVFGPSGVGKTSGVKILADKLNINHGIVNFERLVPEGIQGAKITDPFTRSLGDKEDDMIFIGDEVDKNHDEEVRQELLSILDDKNMISFPTSFGVYREYREISSQKVTCILCGKYDALSQEVKKRLGINRVGFSSGEQTAFSVDDFYAHVNLTDLKKVLGSEELCGRIGNFVGVRQLDSDDLVTIMLYKKESIFNRYQAFFSANNANLELTMDGAKEIADTAIKNYKDLGVRGLDIVMRQLLKNSMLKIDQLQGKRVKIDKGFVLSQLKDTITI